MQDSIESNQLIPVDEVLDYVIDIREASTLWGLSTSRIRQLAIEGKIKAKKIGKEWAISKIQENPKTYRVKRKQLF